MITLHLISLPHTKVSADFCWCAYTSKILKFCKMMGRDYDIQLYAPEGPSVEGTTLHSCITNNERVSIFGEDDTNRLPNWPTQEQTALFNQRVIQALKPEPHDLILLSGGWTHHSIADAFPNNINCEPGVGYEGIYAKFCAFESYAWMHHVYAKKGINDGRFFDAVIPNYFDASEFPILNPGKGEYLLFLGRIVQRKGPHIASEIAERCGLPLRVAGAGGRQVGQDIVAPEITVRNAEYVGTVNVKERAELLAGAKALIVPTTYIEPFGGVAVEAMLCGTPVISTDWGAFTETVQEGVSGFRFRTLAEAQEAVERVSELNPAAIRHYALSRYSLESVRPMFDRWLNRLQTLFGKGWYAEAHPFVYDDHRPWLGGYRKGGDDATTYEHLWRWLANVGIRSVIDVGCGDGVAVKFFESLLGPENVLGIDGMPQKHDRIVEHDFTTGPFLPEQNFDLCWCCEVVEHIEERFLPNLLATFGSANMVLMTHAKPGQQGHHHVNCQTSDYWKRQLASIGFDYDDGLTQTARRLAAKNPNLHNHFIRSGMAFVKHG